MDPLWYKDALIYEVHVRAFCDSNGDGIGDFAGLTQKLPYLQDLGVTCLWLLPFYPSPLRDDGYDIADYTSINPMYGSLDDFKRFLDEAHAQEHPRAHRARHQSHLGSAPLVPARAACAKGVARAQLLRVERYGHRSTPGRESSSSTPRSRTGRSDPVAGQYYWHRFFSHQPDLNFDNPAVLEALLDVMRFWLEHGRGCAAARRDPVSDRA